MAAVPAYREEKFSSKVKHWLSAQGQRQKREKFPLSDGEATSSTFGGEGRDGGSHFILPLPSYFLAPPGETRGIGGEGSPDWRRRRKGEEEVWNSEDDEWTPFSRTAERENPSFPSLRTERGGVPSPKERGGGGKQRMGKVAAVDGRKVKRETFSPARDRMRGIHQ